MVTGVELEVKISGATTSLPKLDWLTEPGNKNKPVILRTRSGEVRQLLRQVQNQASNRASRNKKALLTPAECCVAGRSADLYSSKRNKL